MVRLTGLGSRGDPDEGADPRESGREEEASCCPSFMDMASIFWTK
jgi:hypothetical protein